MMLAYSSVGLTIVKYAFNFTGAGASFNLRRKNHNFFSAVEQILVICWVQFRSSDIVTPKYLHLLTVANAVELS